jgi:hypothetical protein
LCIASAIQGLPKSSVFFPWGLIASCSHGVMAALVVHAVGQPVVIKSECESEGFLEQHGPWEVENDSSLSFWK